MFVKLHLGLLLLALGIIAFAQGDEGKEVNHWEQIKFSYFKTGTIFSYQEHYILVQDIQMDDEVTCIASWSAPSSYVSVQVSVIGSNFVEPLHYWEQDFFSAIASIMKKTIVVLMSITFVYLKLITNSL